AIGGSGAVNSGNAQIGTFTLPTSGQTATIQSLGGTGIYAAAGTGASSGGLTMAGTGTLILGGTSTYTGGTNVQQGTIQLGSNTGLPIGTALTLGNLATSGTLDLAGFNDTVGGLAISGSGTTNQIGNSSTTANS